MTYGYSAMPSDTREEEVELLSYEAATEALGGPISSKSAGRHGLVQRLRRQLRKSLGSNRSFLSPRRIFSTGRILLALVTILVLLTSLFLPSYTIQPPHYATLASRVLASNKLGRGNPSNEKVFICISLYDKGGHLVNGEWSEAILTLIDLLGHENTFLSIYENDSGEDGASALIDFKRRVPCNHEIVVEDVDKSTFPKVAMADGSQRIKRLVYLSEMRNRALRPLDEVSNVKYDKVLFLNDVFFHPIDAVQLLFSTNLGNDGKAEYVAACALDFHNNPIKFYDVYATRDLEGYSMGVPFFPFFSHAGKAQSRNDILAQKDAVRVKSCWSGMAAFDAQYLQASTEPSSSSLSHGLGANNIDPAHPKNISVPARFRAEPEIYFDACECCLLMADVLRLAQGSTDIMEDTAIYVNPYIRVAYSAQVLWWLTYSRRIERLYSGIHWLIDNVARMPTYNKHRTVTESMTFEEEIWVSDPASSLGGHWKIEERQGRSGLYCGVREMQTLLDAPRLNDKNWENSVVPEGRQLF